MDTIESSEETRLIQSAPSNLPDQKNGFSLKRKLLSIRKSKKTAVLVMFLAFLLDLMLLTAVGKF